MEDVPFSIVSTRSFREYYLGFYEYVKCCKKKIFGRNKINLKDEIYMDDAT